MKLLLTLLVLAGAATMQAGLKTAVTASIQETAQGRELVFRGTLTNTSPSAKLYLNDIASSLTGPSAANVALRSGSFFSNVPGVLSAGESYTDSELFRLILSEPAPKGDFEAVITFTGGNTIFANDELARVSCRILVPAVFPAADNTAVYTLSLASSVDSRLEIVAGELGLSFLPTAGKLSYFAEVSMDLALWNPAELVAEPSPTVAGLLSYRYKIPAGADRAFIRLRVEEN